MLMLVVVTVSLAVLASTAQAAHPNAQKLKLDFYKTRCPPLPSAESHKLR
ncbi:hypothetical protein M758_1G027400 [Ceratodon purpureus]|uniref:Uncharacterized protein n=1 Tax=Ceratodon purpureus TaxID=3225 RepID=A0A8T0J0S1_CERPU|nr:hypothetical protein KC19_1G028900 [Ceratodon purpureus]KAG0628449.1 hypothetical protein M758_1G027400 [Ceratodon purpureus]